MKSQELPIQDGQPLSKASQSTEMGGKIVITAFYPDKWDLESEIVQGSSVLLFIQLQIL